MVVESEIVDRPVALDGVAAEAWQAYNAMETTKRRHYTLLERLDLKRRNYKLEPSATEARRLEWLLTDHDAQVRRFTAASVALKTTDPAAHRALFEYVGNIAEGGGRDDGEPSNGGPDAGRDDEGGGGRGREGGDENGAERKTH